ncbi:hypothetical protein [Flavobacterium lipolyticum]|uniref:Uncharacterized protein n=1 Tax=Flavobacterium lipolyticum TaxID=2893754 RepID=A0ABS8M395_9FLAO|nr:hypothetical protein [Flavobacterium sp. F-126]MCC9018683.1 hypothetical protein [Flavobacterium sp. F-126]
MKSKIDQIFNPEKFIYTSNDSQEIFVADYTERTASVRSVEVHQIKPKDIDSLIINNPTKVNVFTSIFLPQCFIDENGKEPKQCECVMNPTNLHTFSWILFIEIKDCKPSNASNYHKECKEKILENVQLFRDKNIISENKIVYAVVSFPRKAKTNFHNHLIKAPEQKQMRDMHKIIIKGTNEITIKNDRIII